MKSSAGVAREVWRSASTDPGGNTTVRSTRPQAWCVRQVEVKVSMAQGTSRHYIVNNDCVRPRHRESMKKENESCIFL